MPAQPVVPFAVYPTAREALTEVCRRERVAGIAANSWSPARHVEARFGFGPDYLGVKSSFNPDLWWHDQVAAGRQFGGYKGMPGLTGALASLSLTPRQTGDWLKRTKGNEQSYAAMTELLSGTLLLQAYSRAQMYESVVEVFANHFNVPNQTPLGTWLRTTLDRDTIRANAFGTFRDMLRAAGRDVMLQRSLGLSVSSKSALNENFGRELLELHTVGVAAGYTQDDVVAAARVLTGRFRDTDYVYKYYGGLHWTGPISLLGFESKNDVAKDGEAVGDALLDYLAMHPATARNLARKFCLRFVSDAPSDELVTAVATAYLNNDTALLPTLSVIFRSTEFWASHGAKRRRPSELVVATIRALGMKPRRDLAATGAAIAEMCDEVGQVPLTWPAPDGFPDIASAWSSAGASLAAWQFQRDLVRGRWQAVFAPWNAMGILTGTVPRTTGQTIDALAANLLGAPLVASQRTTLLQFLNARESTPAPASGATTRELRNLVALFLHSPSHAHR